MARILHLLIDCPWPPRSGGDIRNSAIASALSRYPYRCLGLAGENTGDDNYQTLSAFRNINPWRAVDPGCPTAIRFPQSAIEEIHRASRDHRADTVVLEGVAFASLIKSGLFADQKIVLDMHNIESHLKSQQLATGRLWRRMRSWPFQHRVRLAMERADAACSHVADQTWVCSQLDAERLRALGGRPTHVIPNPVPPNESFEIAVSPERYKNPTPLFVGHLGYFPNVHAVKQLVAGARRLGSSLTATPVVAGRSPSKAIRRFADLGKIRLLENPDHVGGLLADHGYTLLPISHGSGTRIKVLEALAAGLVVIATPQAVEGIEIQDGQHYLAANNSSTMFAALRRMVAMPSTAMQIAKQGREFVRRHHSQSSVTRQVHLSCEELHL